MTTPTGGEPGTTPGIRADFWFGLGLSALGLAAVVESWRMPRLAELNVHPMTAPGLVPGLLGVIIFALGAVLFIRAARAGGWRFSDPEATNHESTGQVWRFIIALALCGGYAAGLVGLLPFWAATFLFVFAFIAIFEWRNNRTSGKRLRALALAAFQAVIVAGVVTYVFQEIFLVRLP